MSFFDLLYCNHGRPKIPKTRLYCVQSQKNQNDFPWISLSHLLSCISVKVVSSDTSSVVEELQDFEPSLLFLAMAYSLAYNVQNCSKFENPRNSHRKVSRTTCWVSSIVVSIDGLSSAKCLRISITMLFNLYETLVMLIFPDIPTHKFAELPA